MEEIKVQVQPHGNHRPTRHYHMSYRLMLIILLYIFMTGRLLWNLDFELEVLRNQENAKNSMVHDEDSNTLFNTTSNRDENPSSTNSTNTSTSAVQKKCQLRDLTNFSPSKIGKVYKSSLSGNMKKSNCLFYDCVKDEAKCDNTLPTNFDGPDPPCCNHILRDMSRIFDETMCSLGLDYSVAFGTLLGLRRSDRIIPWTIDNDYIIPSKDVANAMVLLWDSKKTGMTHIYQGINRMCVTADFSGGKLKKNWGRPKPSGSQRNLYWSGVPYIDFYLGYNSSSIFFNSSTYFRTIGRCRHIYSDIFPTKRVMVYNNTFTQNFPANSDQLLRTFYGKEWRTPRSDKDPYGNRLCPYSPIY